MRRPPNNSRSNKANSISTAQDYNSSRSNKANSIEISSVLKAMNINMRIAASTVRISTGKYITQKEIDRAVMSISEKVSKIKTN